MELQHGNILLRDATKTDAKQLAEWWNDGAMLKPSSFPPLCMLLSPGRLLLLFPRRSFCLFQFLTGFDFTTHDPLVLQKTDVDHDEGR